MAHPRRTSGPRLAWARALVLTLLFVVVAAACGGTSDEDQPQAGDDPAADDTQEPGSDDEVYEWVLATPGAATHPNSQASQWWADRVSELTDGRVRVRMSYAGELVPVTETLTATAEQRIGLGNGNTAFHPGELRISQVTTLPFVATDGEAQVRALQDLYDNYEVLRREYESHGVHNIAFQPLDVIAISGKRELRSTEDLSGLSIRALGLWSEALDSIGANVVGVPYGEVYEAAQRGLIDALGLNFEGVADTRAYEQLGYMADPGVGIVSTSLLMISLDTWNSLPQDIRDAMTQAGEESYDEISRIYAERYSADCENMSETGVEFLVWDEAATEAWREDMGDALVEQWIEQSGLEEAEAMEIFDYYVERMREYEESSGWEGGITVCAS